MYTLMQIASFYCSVSKEPIMFNIPNEGSYASLVESGGILFLDGNINRGGLGEQHEVKIYLNAAYGIDNSECLTLTNSSNAHNYEVWRLQRSNEEETVLKHMNVHLAFAFPEEVAFFSKLLYSRINHPLLTKEEIDYLDLYLAMRDL